MLAAVFTAASNNEIRRNIIEKSSQAGGYAIIDGKLFVVIESRCSKCRAVFDYEYVPYDTSEGTVAR